MYLQLVAIALIALCSQTEGHFPPGLEVGIYTRIVDGTSSSSCASEVNVTSSSLTIPAASVSLGADTCSGGSLMFNDGLEDMPSIIVSAISLDKLLNATLQEALICGPYIIPRGTNLVVIRLSQTLSSTKIALFNAFLPQGVSLSQSISADMDYIATSSMCVWKQTIPSPSPSPTMTQTEETPNESVEPTEAAPASMEDGFTCFPGSAAVTREDGAVAHMSELQVGDRIYTGRNRHSAIFAWTHHDRHVIHKFIRIHTSLNTPLRLTKSHFVHTFEGPLIPAEQVSIGDRLVMADGTPLVVRDVDYVWERGLFNPHTFNGDIVVDGVLTSTYTQAVQPNTAHALLSPLRWLFRVTMWATKSLTLKLSGVSTLAKNTF